MAGKIIAKDDNNFALIVVGIVAIVGIVGMLNLGGITGKNIVTTSETSGAIKLSDGSLAWCDALDCKAANGKVCNEIPAGNEAPCGYNKATSAGQTYAVYWAP